MVSDDLKMTIKFLGKNGEAAHLRLGGDHRTVTVTRAGSGQPRNVKPGDFSHLRAAETVTLVAAAAAGDASVKG